MTYEEFCQHVIGANIYALRMKLWLTQAELAKKLGIHWVHLSRVETGAIQPSLRLLWRIAELGGVPLLWMFEEHEAPEEAAEGKA